MTILQINYGAAFIEFSAEEAKRLYGDIIPAPLSDRRLFVLKQVTWCLKFLFHQFYYTLTNTVRLMG